MNQTTVRYVLAAKFLFILIVSVSGQQFPSPALDWELVNPFRFIRHQDSIDELRKVYQSLPIKNALSLERKLQEMDEAKVSANREKLKACNQIESGQEKTQCLANLNPNKLKLSYLGWFSDLADNNYEKTCWDAQKLQFRNEAGCENYLDPQSHKVRVWVKNPPSSDFSQIQWFKGNRVLDPSEYQRCDEKYRKGICIEFDVERSENPEKIAVRDAAGSLVAESENPIQIKDKLVVGLGDSYASGEGNPDKPAEFREGRTDADFLYLLEYRKAPRRDKNSDAAWLDARCHRSMYSYQFKTALQLALSNPKEAVTYVSFSCSGAVTEEITSKKQKQNEPVSGQPKKILPQIDSLKATLNGREINYLLLSTGGNDIGFAGYAAYVLTSGTLLRVAGKKPAVNTIDRIYGLSASYRELHKKLLDPQKGVKIKGCNGADSDTFAPCPRILLTPYPDVFNDENGDICRVDRDEFLIPFKKDHGREARIKRLKHIVFNPLREIQENAYRIPLKDDEIQKNNFDEKTVLGWTIIDGHFKEYLTHGFCARSEDEKQKKEFIMPERTKDNWFPFEPSEYRAYKSRPRWIRLPVDSKLTTDQVQVWWKFTFDLFLIDDRSNVMHPTAEGLSATAEANFQKMQELN